MTVKAIALVLVLCLTHQAAATRTLAQSAVAPAVPAAPSVNVAPSPAIAYLGNLAAGALGLFNLFNPSQLTNVPVAPGVANANNALSSLLGLLTGLAPATPGTAALPQLYLVQNADGSTPLEVNANGRRRLQQDPAAAPGALPDDAAIGGPSGDPLVAAAARDQAARKSAAAPLPDALDAASPLPDLPDLGAAAPLSKLPGSDDGDSLDSAAVSPLTDDDSSRFTSDDDQVDIAPVSLDGLSEGSDDIPSLLPPAIAPIAGLGGDDDDDDDTDSYLASAAPLIALPGLPDVPNPLAHTPLAAVLDSLPLQPLPIDASALPAALGDVTLPQPIGIVGPGIVRPDTGSAYGSLGRRLKQIVGPLNPFATVPSAAPILPGLTLVGPGQAGTLPVGVNPVPLQPVQVIDPARVVSTQAGTPTISTEPLLGRVINNQVLTNPVTGVQSPAGSLPILGLLGFGTTPDGSFFIGRRLQSAHAKSIESAQSANPRLKFVAWLKGLFIRTVPIQDASEADA